MCVSCIHNIILSVIINLTPPSDGCVKLNIDGSCVASGDVGFGGLLRDNKGNWITGFSSNERQGDALFAELFGFTMV